MTAKAKVKSGPTKLTPEQRIKAGLRRAAEIWATIDKQHFGRDRFEGWKYADIHALVLAEGTFCEAQQLPEGIEKGPMKECFTNAWELVLDDPAYTYVEGFCDPMHGGPIHHAWVVDAENRVIDNTITEPENCRFYGVKLCTRFVARTLKRKGTYTVFDWADKAFEDYLRMGLPEEAKVTKGAIMSSESFETPRAGDSSDGTAIAFRRAVSSSSATTELPTRRTTTGPGDAADKIIAALCKHHEYREYGDRELSCGFWEPCGSNQLARLAGVAKGTVTEFFRRKLRVDAHEKPRHAYYRICRTGSLPTMLQIWRGDYPTRNLQLFPETRDDDGGMSGH